MKYQTLLVLIVAINSSRCAKILGVFPAATSSHFILGSTLMKALAERGHDVTIIAPFAERNLPKNGSYREVVLTGVAEKQNHNLQGMNFFEKTEVSPFVMMFFMLFFVINELAEDVMKHPNVQELLNSGEEFDAVIVVQVMNEAYKGFAAHFKAPLIQMSTLGPNTFINMIVGNPTPTSYIPEFFLGYSREMSLWQRSVNIVMNVYSQFLYYFSLPMQEKLHNTYFPKNPPFHDVANNVSLVLLNSHTSINQAVPLVPNMVEIGGYHVQPPKPLPEDLQKFLDEATEGVIYFSMGSILKSAFLPPEKRDAFLGAFSKLKQKVLWKWEDDVLPGQPKNVKLGKWLPQQDILAHANVKLFITHGGLLSTTETIYHGVPVLAIPVAVDQKLNANKIVNDGFGISLAYKDISEETLTEYLKELLENPKYAQNAKKRSQLFHDRPVKPIDTATYWVEYVARHGGAPHLRVAGVDLPWYQYMLVDVIAFLALLVLLGFYITYKISRKVYKKLCSKCSKEQKIKKH